MKNHKAFRYPVTLVEVLLVVGIVTTLGGFALRVIYARRMIAWEYGIIRSFGIDPEICRIILGVRRGTLVSS
jgi:phage shock protein PspC (stress-responsive transcriptional regulator)